VPEPIVYREVFNTDRAEFGGSGMAVRRVVPAEGGGWHNRPHHLRLTLPPLAVLFLRPDDQERGGDE
jgi:1,4-alpha-glucan branching enzyme